MEFLKYFFIAVWFFLFSLAAFWLEEGKNVVLSFTFIGLSMVVLFILYSVKLFKKL